MRNLFLLLFTFFLMSSFKSNSLNYVNTIENLNPITKTYGEAEPSENSGYTIEYIIKDEFGRYWAWVRFSCGVSYWIIGDDFNNLCNKIIVSEYELCYQ